MKSVLLIGVGRFGKNVALELESLEHEVMAIDCDEEKIQTIAPHVEEARIGDSTDREFLESLGVRDFDVCIVAIGEDFQSSLETTWLLRDMGAKRIISRASRRLQEKFLLNNGADEVVYPEKQLASWTVVRIINDNVMDFMELDDKSGIVEIETPSEWIGKTIGKLDIRKKYGVIILGKKDLAGINFNIKPDTTLKEGEILLVFGEKDSLENILN